MGPKKLFAIAGMVAAFTLAEEWKVDSEHAQIKFSIKGPFGTVHGSFGGLKAKIAFDEKNPSSATIEASVDPNTVATGIGIRNHDLRTEEIWLDTKKFPEISFHSTKIEKSDKGFKAVGNLNLKGVSKTIEIPFTLTGNENSGTFKGEFTINREDFHIGKKGGSVGDNVTVTLEVPVKK